MRKAIAGAAAVAGMALLPSAALASSSTERLLQPGTPFGSQQQRGGHMPRTQMAAPPAGMTERQKIAWWNVVRKVAVCVSAIGAFVIGNGIWITKLRKAGGVWKAAKRVVTAKGKRAKLVVLGGIFGNVLGLDQIAEKC